MDKHEKAGGVFRRVLTDVLDDLLDQVPSDYGQAFRIEDVSQSLRNISLVYKKGLSSPWVRSDWNEAANRCAYVFLYLMHHCNVVFSSLQSNLLEISAYWHYRYNLKVCSIGGGPGSDLLGLTTFLSLNQMFPSDLRCLVLDLYPNWKNTWDKIHSCISDDFKVAYRKCDVVKDTGVHTDVLRFIQEADMLTLVKSFSAMSAFLRDQSRGDFLRSILRELKPGCFVLYIDNDNAGDDQFQREFASQTGLEIVYESRGPKAVPSGEYSHTIRKYCHLLDFSPMRSCDVNIQLFRKRRSTILGLNVNHGFYRNSPHTLKQLHGPSLVFSSANRLAARFQRQTPAFPGRAFLPQRGGNARPRVVPESRTPHDFPRNEFSPFQKIVLVIGFFVVAAIFNFVQSYHK